MLILSLPFLASGVVAAADVPPILAYLLFPGRELLVGLGLVIVGWSLVQSWLSVEPIVSGLDSVARTRIFSIGAFLLVGGLAFYRVPQAEKEAEAFGGDEPKYLRIAYSLLRDTDADIGSGRTTTPDFSLRLQQIRNLLLTGRDAASDLFQPVAPPPDHVWNAGNWTVRGRHGGLYHLQPPGLPALVAISLGLGEAWLPERDPGIYVSVLLAILWTLGARELWLLSREITDDALGSAVFSGVVLFSAPVFVGGYQLFPESLSLLVFPWLVRRLRASERDLGWISAVGCGLVSGYLLWVHPKLTVVAVLFAFMALIRPRTSAIARLLFLAGFSLMAFTALLYCFQISGLFRPEGLYIRQAEEYVGSPNPLSLRFMAGLVKGLIGGRDGLLLFAPIVILGFTLDPLRRTSPRGALEMWSLFVVVWLTSAVHDGASLGSPARLMAPVVFIPAFFLVRTLRDEPSAARKASAILLFLLGARLTATMAGDWRRNVNPYRTMFGNPATNFEPSLPGNSFSDAAYVADLEKAVFVLFVLGLGRFAFRRWGAEELMPARFGVSVLAAAVALAFGLHWLSPS